MTTVRRRILWIAVIALICAAAMTVWVLWQRGRDAQEELAIVELRRLGALVVLGGDRKHARSVNLSMVRDADQLGQAIACLPDLTRLTALDVSRTAVTDEDLAVAGRVKSLGSLSLVGTGVSDQGLRQLGGLRRLETLYVMETQVTSASLEGLAALTGLRILDLSHTQIAGGDFSPLARLPHLEWLLLRDLTLDQESLAGLATAPTLRRLSLQGSQYDPSSLKSLRESLSELQIDE